MGSFLDVGEGEHTELDSSFHSPFCIASFVSSPLLSQCICPSPVVATGAWTDCGWFIALQQSEATVVLSCFTSAWGDSALQCSKSTHYAGSKHNHCLPGQKPKRVQEEQHHLIHPQENWNHMESSKKDSTSSFNSKVSCIMTSLKTKKTIYKTMGMFFLCKLVSNKNVFIMCALKAFFRYKHTVLEQLLRMGEKQTIQH